MADAGVSFAGLTEPWLDGLRGAFQEVKTSGQAYAAIVEGERFARNASTEIAAGGSWFWSDGWRQEASRGLDDGAARIHGLREKYSPDSSAPIDPIQWIDDYSKVFYVYLLAKSTAEAWPGDVEGSGFWDVMERGLTDLAEALAAVPGAAISYAGDVAGKAVDAAVGVGRRTVRGAGEIAKDATEAASAAIDAVIPWTPILLAVGVLALGVVGVVYLSKSGALGNVARLVPKGAA